MNMPKFDYMSLFDKSVLFKNLILPSCVVIIQYFIDDDIKHEYIYKSQLLLKAGTVLYRVRNYEEGVDVANPNDFLSSPHSKQGRFNDSSQRVLYLSGSEQTCFREVGVAEGDRCFVARFRLKQDVLLGGFCVNITDEHINPKYLRIFDSSLSVPIVTRDSVVSFYESLIFTDATFVSDHDLSFKLAYCLNSNATYYDYTNFIANLFRNANYDGIVYKSCYTAYNYVYDDNNGIEAFNIALFNDNFVEFVDAKECVCSSNFSRISCMKMIANGQRDITKHLTSYFKDIGIDIDSLSYRLDGLIGYSK